MAGARSSSTAVHGILVTFRRPAALSASLESLVHQDHPLHRLVVVDNGPSAETEAVIAGYRTKATPIHHLRAPENLGPAGGIAVGMVHVVDLAEDSDWIVLLDDNDPLPGSATLGQLVRFANEMTRTDPKTAGVGLTGARFDWRRGRIIRIGDQELKGPVAVDYIPGSRAPIYQVGVIRSVGPFLERLFFGYEELEFGLRLRQRGFSLYAHGDLWWEIRSSGKRLGVSPGPTVRLGEPNWRRYYSIRNLIYILRHFSRSGAAVRVSLAVGLLKPTLNLPVRPRLALQHLRLGWAAGRDAWLARMGRTVDPATQQDWDDVSDNSKGLIVR